MIKDRVIQKRIKGKVLAMAMTAVMASFFVTMGVKAGPEEGNLQDITGSGLNTAPFSLTINSHDGGECPGHYFKDTVSKGHGIRVEGGKHRIVLEGATINAEAAESAISVEEGATLDLVLIGDNKLSGGLGMPGISVPLGATLNIVAKEPSAKLEAKSGGNSAGIGGYGITPRKTGTAGTINIEGGTIIATGGKGGAGIGGYNGGGSGTINIKDATVEATGGDADPSIGIGKASPGIGVGANGNDSGSTSTVKISGATITAIGGKESNNTRTYGINADELSSVDNENTSVVVKSTNGLPKTGMDITLNGLVWSIEKNGNTIDLGDTCTAYGKAVLPDPFDLGGRTLEIWGEDTSVALPDSMTMWTNLGTIVGDGKLIGADRVIDPNGGVSPNIQRAVMLSADNVNPGNLTYTGEDLRAGMFTVDETDEATGYPVYNEGWDITIGKDNYTYPPTEKIIDAGEYEVTFTKTGFKSFSKKVTVKPYTLTASDCTVSVDPVNYTGGAYAKDDVKVKLTYENKITNRTTSIEDKNQFSKSFSDKANMVDAGKVPFTIKFKNNFSGEIPAEFVIEPVSLKTAFEANTMQMTIDGKQVPIAETSFPTYNNDEKKMKVEALLSGLDTTRHPGGALVQGTDFTVEYLREKEDSTAEAEATTDYTSAGTITVRVKGIKNFSDSCDATYKIKRKKLDATSITAEKEGGKYDGNNQVKVTKFEWASGYETALANGDTVDDVTQDVKIIGTIDSADVPLGTLAETGYTTVTLENTHVGGPKGANYTIDGVYTVGGTPALTAGIKFEPGDAPEIAVDGIYRTEDNETFIYTVNASASTGYVEPSALRYCMDTPDDPDSWQTSAEFSGIEPSDDPTNPTKHIFYVKAEKTNNVAAAGGVAPYPYYIEGVFNPLPYEGEAPDPKVFELSFPEINENNMYDDMFEGVITSNDESGKGVEYSFDEGASYSESATASWPSGKACTAFVRYKGDRTHEASTPSPITADAPEGKTKQPLIHIEGESGDKLAFAGGANIKIDCDTGDAAIYYTTDGTDPKNLAEPNYDGVFPITKDTQVRAIAKKDGMLFSDEAEAKNFVAKGRRDPGAKVELLADSHLSDYLKKTYETAEGTKIAMLNILLDETKNNYKKQGYLSTNAAAYDLDVWMEAFDEDDKSQGKQAPTQEDFTNGITVTIPYSQLQVLDGLSDGVSGSTHDFKGLHMYSNDGSYEEIPVIEAENKSGLSITVHGASPIVIAWNAKGNPDDPNNPDNPDDPNNPDNPDDPNNPDNPDDPNNPDDPTNPDDPNNPDNPDPNANGDGTGNQNGDGTNGNGTTSSTNAAEQGASDDSKSALSNLMPKTGDPISFIPWIAAAVVSIGVIVGIVKKKNGKKKKPNKTTKKTTQKSSQKTKKKK